MEFPNPRAADKPDSDAAWMEVWDAAHYHASAENSLIAFWKLIDRRVDPLRRLLNRRNPSWKPNPTHTQDFATANKVTFA